MAYACVVRARAVSSYPLFTLRRFVPTLMLVPLPVAYIDAVFSHGVNGLLVEVPTVAAWFEVLCKGIGDDDLFACLRFRASDETNSFEQTVLGLRLEKFLVQALHAF